MPIRSGTFTVFLFCFPILVVRFLINSKAGLVFAKCAAPLIPIIVFEIYTALVHQVGFARLLYIAFIILLFIFAASGCINMRLFLKYATVVIDIAFLLLIVQYISHYIFNYTINLRPFHLLVSQDVIWVENALSGAQAGRMYRPAAFFLEPSHLFLYSFPILAIMLLSPDITSWRRKQAIIISAAMLLSTSGFGVVATVGLWGLYLLFYHGDLASRRKTLQKIFSVKTWLVLLSLVIVFFILYFSIPLFQRSVVRIFSSVEGSSAIDGRTRLAINFIKKIEGSAIFFGTPGGTANLDFNLAGFFATYIKWGLVGVVLSYWFYTQGLFKLKKAYFWITMIILVISFFTAHTHGTFYMFYYIIYLIEGYFQALNRKPSNGKELSRA